jgi:hypothetical protein
LNVKLGLVLKPDNLQAYIASGPVRTNRILTKSIPEVKQPQRVTLVFLLSDIHHPVGEYPDAPLAVTREGYDGRQVIITQWFLYP